MRPADRMWQQAAAELAPARSLARVEAKANLLLTTVGLLATALTGLGLAAADLLDLPSAARALAFAAVAAAVVGAGVALGSLTLRVTPALAPTNLAAVEAWYRRQFRSAWLVAVAGWLLVAALAAVGAATAVTLLAGDEPATPRLTLRTQPEGTAVAATAEVALSGADPETVVVVELAGLSGEGLAVVLGRAVGRPGPDGDVTLTLTARGLTGYETVQLDATTAEHACTATLPVTDTAVTVPADAADTAAVADMTDPEDPAPDPDPTHPAAASTAGGILSCTDRSEEP